MRLRRQLGQACLTVAALAWATPALAVDPVGPAAPPVVPAPIVPAPPANPAPLPSAPPVLPGGPPVMPPSAPVAPAAPTKKVPGAAIPVAPDDKKGAPAAKPAVQVPPDGQPLPPIDEARPPLPPEPDQRPVPWERHLEFGVSFNVTELLAHNDGAGNKTPVRLLAGPGFTGTLDWKVLKYLWFTGYLNEGAHSLTLPKGSLGVAGQLSGDSARMYTFGARATPNIYLGTRGRLWITAGAGWGRVNYPKIYGAIPGQDPYVIQDRGVSILEIPVGVGGSLEVIPRWLVLRAEFTGSFLPSQRGEAVERAQAIYGDVIHRVGPMPWLDASFTQSIGLALVL